MVAIWTGGDPAGYPVIYLPGTPASRLQSVPAEPAAVRGNVRLLSFNRPGYGASTDGPTTLRSVARDILTLADEWNLDRFPVLGASGGGPYALAAAATAPDRVSAVGSVVGVGVGPWP